MGRIEALSKFLKGHDRELFVKRIEGKLCVLRRSHKSETYDVEGKQVTFILPDFHLVFALTDTWNLHGKPREWGSLVILDRLQKHDLWNRDLARESIESIESAKATRDRAIDNHIESYLIENRREFARATNDINTGTLKKTDKRRNYGNC